MKAREVPIEHLPTVREMP